MDSTNHKVVVDGHVSTETLQLLPLYEQWTMKSDTSRAPDMPFGLPDVQKCRKASAEADVCKEVPCV